MNYLLLSKFLILRNEQEIEEIIKSAKTPAKITSPTNLYLSSIPDYALSPEDKKYIEIQDKNRLKKYKEASEAAAKKIAQKPNELSDALKNLKDQQKKLKELNQNYKLDTVDSVAQKPKPKPVEKHSPVNFPQ